MAEEAFRFANRAMWQQRVRSTYARKVRKKELPAGAPVDPLDVPENRTWRLFQLAFVLLNLPSITRFDHSGRAASDQRPAWFDGCPLRNRGGRTVRLDGERPTRAPQSYRLDGDHPSRARPGAQAIPTEARRVPAAGRVHQRQLLRHPAPSRRAVPRATLSSRLRLRTALSRGDDSCLCRPQLQYPLQT